MTEEQEEAHSSWSAVAKGRVSRGQIAQGSVNHNNKLGFHSNRSRKPPEGLKQQSHLMASVRGGPQMILAPWFTLSHRE